MSSLAIDQIVTTVNYAMRLARAALEVEESGRAVAAFQGNIAGYKHLISFMSAEFSLRQTEIEDLGDAPLLIPDLEDETLETLTLDIGLLVADPRWLRVLERIDEHVEEMKKHLLFEAEKSRDLDLCQGQYKGETIYITLFSAVESENRRRLEKREQQRKNPDLFAQNAGRI